MRGAERPRNDRDFCKECGARQAGDREGRPYESVTRGAVGRADRGVRPYGEHQELRGGTMWGAN